MSRPPAFHSSSFTAKVAPCSSSTYKALFPPHLTPCSPSVSVLHSLEQLHTQLSEVDVDYDELESLSEGHKTALYASVALVKQMLSETQVGRSDIHSRLSFDSPSAYILSFSSFMYSMVGIGRYAFI